MDATDSLKIIEQMLSQSKKNLVKNSFYFILWAGLMIPSGIIEWYLIREGYFYSWIVWPISGTIGGITSFIYGLIQGKKAEIVTAGDKIAGYTWGAFGVCMLFSIFYAIMLKQPPHALILMLAGGSTFVTGGISKFKPFIFGAISLELAAIACAFFIEPQYHGPIFSLGLFTGYLIPGILLSKIEDG